MPAISFIHSIREITSNVSSPNTSDQVFVNVLCAWPVSGQYGPGSRYLYYVLVAACVFARKLPWLRDPCLVAALIFPAVAALHSIVLAILHVDNGVDMDIYGALQFCTIGILIAPLTVGLSSTYFNNSGRGIIFLWTTLVVAGLLALTVEFQRVSSIPCYEDDAFNPFTPDMARNFKLFPYEHAMCGLTCTVDNGPYSPMRQGSTNEVYVIPEPKPITFGTATILAAACCIPPILTQVFMFFKILDYNWMMQMNGAKTPGRHSQSTASVANRDGVFDARQSLDASPRQVLEVEGDHRRVSSDRSERTDDDDEFIDDIEEVDEKQKLLLIRSLLIPVFGSLVFAIIVVGEVNFWSPQLQYRTEPMGSVGQWAPVVGTSLAALGSLYYMIMTDDRRNFLTDEINRVMRRLSRAAHVDDTLPDDGPVTDYPTTPGERHRNNRLQETEEAYNAAKRTPSRSRAPSFVESPISELDITESPRTSDAAPVTPIAADRSRPRQDSLKPQQPPLVHRRNRTIPDLSMEPPPSTSGVPALRVRRQTITGIARRLPVFGTSRQSQDISVPDIIVSDPDVVEASTSPMQLTELGRPSSSTSTSSHRDAFPPLEMCSSPGSISG